MHVCVYTHMSCTHLCWNEQQFTHNYGTPRYTLYCTPFALFVLDHSNSPSHRSFSLFKVYPTVLLFHFFIGFRHFFLFHPIDFDCCQCHNQLKFRCIIHTAAGQIQLPCARIMMLKGGEAHINPIKCFVWYPQVYILYCFFNDTCRTQ